MNYLYLLSSIGEKIRARRGKVTVPRSHSYQGTQAGQNMIFFFKLFSPDVFLLHGPSQGGNSDLGTQKMFKK